MPLPVTTFDFYPEAMREKTDGANGVRFFLHDVEGSHRDVEIIRRRDNP